MKMAIRDGMLCIDFNQSDLEDGAYFSHCRQTQHGECATKIYFPAVREGDVMTLHLPLAKATAKALGGQAKFLKTANSFLVRDDAEPSGRLARADQMADKQDR